MTTTEKRDLLRLKEEIYRAYVEYNVGSDRIAVDPDHRAQFASLISPALKCTEDQVIKRLINMRKNKELPRLRDIV